jgi:transaldolase
MAKTPGYFHRVHHETSTRLWINNPSGEDARRSIEAGAINCTTNPAYCSKLLQSEPAYIRSVIDEVVHQEEDNDVAAERVYLHTAARLMEMFLPLYQLSGGKQGYVTIQDDPRRDDDPQNIVDAALRAQALGPNYMAKIPVMESGMVAIEELVARNIACCATEVFAVSQAIEICDRYQKAARKSGNHPAFFVTHITGIFDQYLGELVKSEHIHIAPEILSQAGTIICRRQYQVLKERGYPGTMLGGGARSLLHFTEFVGGNIHITINWKEADELLRLDGPVVKRMDTPTPQEVVEELAAKVPSFRRAYDESAMHPHEFEAFGPLMFFKTMFLNGWIRLVDEVAERRVRLAGD